MGEEIKIDLNDKKNRIIMYNRIKNKSLENGKEYDISETEMIDKVINYIQNYRKEGYIKPEELDFLEFGTEIDQIIIKELIAYLNNAKKKIKDEEKRKSRREKKEAENQKNIERYNEVEKTISFFAEEGINEIDAITKYINDIHEGKIQIESKTERKYILERLNKKLASLKEQKKKEEIAKIKKINNAWDEVRTSLDDEILKTPDEKSVLEKFISDIEGDEEILDSDQKEFVLKKLNDRLGIAIEKDNIERKNAEKIMEKVSSVAKSEEEKGIKSKIEIWTHIRKMLIGENKSSEIQLEMSEKCEEYISSFIDQIIQDEKDQVYFEQTEAFTRGFSFLGEYSESAYAKHGHVDAKFTDKEAYDRFYRLRESVRRSSDEEDQIGWLLRKGKIDSGDRRILEARKEVIQKEKERAEAEGR